MCGERKWYLFIKHHKEKYFHCMCELLYNLIGLDVKTTDGVKKMRCLLMIASLDLPARALVLNQKQFNGQHGCSFCEDKGTTTDTNPLHRWWPPNSTSKARTHESVLKNAEDATKTKKPVR